MGSKIHPTAIIEDGATLGNEVEIGPYSYIGGKVTLGEAYQFAFQETMARTATTAGGTQHPTYDIKMAGTGDVVLTDLRETSATIVLGPDFEGRFFVRDSAGQLVAELHKPAGRSVELGVEAGAYEVSFEQPQRLFRVKLALAEGERRSLGREELRPAGRRATRLRGGSPADPWSRGGRSRVEILAGGSGVEVHTTETPGATSDHVSGGCFELGYAYFLQPDLSLDLALVGQDLDVTSTQVEPEESVERISGSYGAFLGARYYAPLRGSVRPFLLGGVGTLTDWVVTDMPNATTVSQTNTDFAFRVGGGVEARIGSHASLALRLMLTRRDGRSTRTGAFGFGWTFGQGR